MHGQSPYGWAYTPRSTQNRGPQFPALPTEAEISAFEQRSKKPTTKVTSSSSTSSSPRSSFSTQLSEKHTPDSTSRTTSQRRTSPSSFKDIISKASAALSRNRESAKNKSGSANHDAVRIAGGEEDDGVGFAVEKKRAHEKLAREAEYKALGLEQRTQFGSGEVRISE